MQFQKHDILFICIAKKDENNSPFLRDILKMEMISYDPACSRIEGLPTLPSSVRRSSMLGNQDSKN